MPQDPAIVSAAVYSYFVDEAVCNSQVDRKRDPTNWLE